MHFYGLMVALVASASIVIAAPTDNGSNVSDWTCPNGWLMCGVRSCPLHSVIMRISSLKYYNNRHATVTLARLVGLTSKARSFPCVDHC